MIILPIFVASAVLNIPPILPGFSIESKIRIISFFFKSKLFNAKFFCLNRAIIFDDLGLNKIDSSILFLL